MYLFGHRVGSLREITEFYKFNIFFKKIRKYVIGKFQARFIKNYI